jgi:hypothetical protein
MGGIRHLSCQSSRSFKSCMVRTIGFIPWCATLRWLLVRTMGFHFRVCESSVWLMAFVREDGSCSQLFGALLVMMVSTFSSWLFCKATLIRQTELIMLEGALRVFMLVCMVELIRSPTKAILVPFQCWSEFLAKGRCPWANTRWVFSVSSVLSPGFLYSSR